MKKSALFFILLFGIGASSVLLAEEQEAERMPRPWENQVDSQPADGDKKMGSMGKMDGKMKGMGMMGMHQQPTAVATSDGGIVVIVGGKLIKYDASLNLVKEVELKKDKGPKPMDGMDKMEMPVSPAPVVVQEPLPVVAEVAPTEVPEVAAEAPADAVWREAGQAGE